MTTATWLAPGRRILVTGGCGFVGSALVRRLVAAGCAVTNLDALTYAASPEAVADLSPAGPYRFVHADVRDAGAASEALASSGAEAVVHCAAETHVDRSIDAPEAFVQTNVLGTERLLSATLRHWLALDPEARAAFRFVQASTDETFGALGPGHPPFTEASPYAPRSPYAASKAAADHLVLAYRATYGLPAIVAHASNTYGPWQAPEKLAPLAILRAAEAAPVPLYGDGSQRRDWLHVDDHAAGLAAALDRGEPGGRYLFGGGAERANRDVVAAICDRVEARLGPLPDGRSRRTLIAHVADRPGHDFRYALDGARTRAALGWRPAATFEAALAATVDWYLDNRAWAEGATRRTGRARLGLGPAGTPQRL